MAVPLEVEHIWSRDDGAGRVSLDENDVTISEMIQDELNRLETQQTKEFYEQPGDSGAIAESDELGLRTGSARKGLIERGRQAKKT